VYVYFYKYSAIIFISIPFFEGSDVHLSLECVTQHSLLPSGLL